jgi:hypothetical protein
MNMVGYHYTSNLCWEAIQDEGLQPYRIQRAALAEFRDSDTAMGIWIWTHRLTGRDHVGSVLYQMAAKAEFTAVLLRVQYDPSTVLKDSSGLNDMHLLHAGSFGRLEYHDFNQRAVIVTAPILPNNIELLNTYHFELAWTD